MGKYQEAARYFGEDAEFNQVDPLAVASEEDQLTNDDYNQLVWKQVEDEARGMNEVNWEIPDEVINAAYANASEQQAMADNVRLWLSEHPVDTAKMLADHLDAMANNYEQSQAGRFARIAATEAHKLHWLLMGSDEAITNLTEVPGW